MNILTDTLAVFIGLFQLGWNNILPDITSLFAILLILEVTMFGLFMALFNKSSYTEAIMKTFVIGIWGWIVFNFPQLSLDLFNSLIQIGFTAGGLDPALDTTHDLLLDPSRIAGYGMEATAPLAGSLSFAPWDLADSLVLSISYLIIVLCFLILAIQVFVCQIEFYLTAAIIGIFLPFALMSPTVSLRPHCAT